MLPEDDRIIEKCRSVEIVYSQTQLCHIGVFNG